MSQTLNPASPDVKRWAIPLIVFLLALGLRFAGIGWGLPNKLHQQTYHPDEGIIWDQSQRIEPTKLSFTPHFYNYGTLYLTTLKVASDVVGAYTGGKVEPAKPEETWDFMRKCHLAGRAISAFAGAGTVLVVFFILRRFVNEFGAVFGALAIAFAPAHVVHSQFQTVDVLATFLIAVSSLYALRMIRLEGVVDKASDIKLAVLSGLFCGLSAGTKYTGIFCFLTILTIALAVHKRAGIKLCLIALGMALASFLLTTPGIFLDTEIFMRDFVFEMKHTAEGHGIVFAGTSSGFIYTFANIFLGMGLILGLLGLAGLGLGAYRKHLWILGLLAFFVPYYLLIGRAEVKFIRYTFPLYVGLGVGFGWLMGRAREKGGKWHGLVGLGILGLGGFFGGGLQLSSRYLSYMAGPEPRDEAGAYLAGKDVSIGLATDPWFYTPAFHPNLSSRYVLQVGIPMVGYLNYDPFDEFFVKLEKPKILRYVPEEYGLRFVRERMDWDERLLTESKPDYIAISSFEVEGIGRVQGQANPDPGMKATADRATAFMKRVEQGYVVDRIFGPPREIWAESPVHDMLYVQPTVYVWKRKPAP